MGLIKEFKEFAMRGNVVDLAVGVIIGGAFGKIVSSLVTDVIMPPIGYLVGGVEFGDLSYNLKPAYTDEAGVLHNAVNLNYGTFIQTVVDFLIIAFVVFMVVKGMNRLIKKQAAAPAEPPKPTNQEVLLGEIRDLLKDKK